MCLCVAMEIEIELEIEIEIEMGGAALLKWRALSLSCCECCVLLVAL